MHDTRSNPGALSPSPRYPGSFMLAVRAALEQVGWRAKKWLGVAVECADQDGRDQVLGLENLYRRLRHEDRAAWPKLIVELLRSVPADAVDTVKLEEVADRILVRVGPPLGPVMSPEREVWFQPLLGRDLGVTLVVDHPNTMSYVAVGQIEESGRAGAEWLETGLNNLVQRTPPDAVQVVHEESGLMQCEVGDAYDSSRALILDRLLPQHLQDGWFVAIPGRDQLLVLPVTRSTFEFVAWLRMIAAKAFRTVPYAISPDVFWIQGRKWHLFDIQLQGGKAVVTPPPEFEEVMRRLSQET